MLMFFDPTQTGLKSAQDNNESFNLISHLHREEDAEVYTYHADIPWRFDTFTSKHVYGLYHNLRKSSITPTLQQAYEQELGLVEMCSGDARNPTQLLITPDLDIQLYQRQWFHAYWQAHGYPSSEKKETNKIASFCHKQGRSGQ